MAAFVDALRVDYGRRQRVRLATGFAPSEAKEEAVITLARRIEAVLSFRSELAGHFGAALVRAELLEVAVALQSQDPVATLFIPNPLERLNELAQEAARRFDRLPTGIGRIVPRHPAQGLSFNRYAQSVIEAPLIAAEFATERRPPASTKELLALINLRLVDPVFFDAALPAAIAIVLKEASQ